MAVVNTKAPATTNKAPAKQTFGQYVQLPAVQNMIQSTLGDKEKVSKFTTGIVSAVTTNPALQECDSKTLISGALLGETLNLSPSPQLGHYYLVPFNDTKNNRKVATFQLGLTL